MTAGRTTHSQSTDWCTPFRYVSAVKKMFKGVIELDPCSNQWAIVKAKTEFSLPEKDGLNEKWNYKTIYVNPPYGADRKRKTTIKKLVIQVCPCKSVFSFGSTSLNPRSYQY